MKLSPFVSSQGGTARVGDVSQNPVNARMQMQSAALDWSRPARPKPKVRTLRGGPQKSKRQNPGGLAGAGLAGVLVLAPMLVLAGRLGWPRPAFQADPRENGSARSRVLQPPCRTPENYSAHFSKSSSPANTQRAAHLKITSSTLQISHDVQAHEEGRHLRQGT